MHNFPKGICPKVNVLARLEFELVYYNFAGHRFNHYTTRTPPMFIRYRYVTLFDNNDLFHLKIETNRSKIFSRYINLLSF